MANRVKVGRSTIIVTLSIVAVLIALVAIVISGTNNSDPTISESAPSHIARPTPDATNTGVPQGTSLTKSTSVRATTPNQIIDSLDITGDISIEAPGVVVKNSRIHGGGPFGILVRSGSVTISDSEISGFANGIAGDNWTAYRANIHSTKDDGVKLGSNVLLQDSWIHDLTPESDSHADGAQMQSGVTNLVVRNNSIDLTDSTRSNSAIFLSPDQGPSTDGPVLIEGNWLDGGNYTLYCVDGSNGQYRVGNISILDNRFGRHALYGPSSINVPLVQSGNVWADSNEPLTL